VYGCVWAYVYVVVAVVVLLLLLCNCALHVPHMLGLDAVQTKRLLS